MAVTVTIWHNPRCGKSRETLKLIEARNILPVIRLYLTDPPTPDEIRAARDLLGVPAVGMMRTKETAFREAALSRDMDDDRLIAAMAAHPILIERPIVFANGKAALGRPPEAVLAIL
jgi:arsenate reductase (glutaredoxin)